MNKQTQRMIKSFGLSVNGNTVDFLNIHKEDSCRIQYSSTPIALVGYACASLPFSKGRFPKLSFLRLVDLSSTMDLSEIDAFAAICGFEFNSSNWLDSDQFFCFLRKIISDYDLWHLFDNTVPAIYGHYHNSVRTHGFDWTDESWPEIPGALKKWQADYRKLPQVRQLIVSTILQLYQSDRDSQWLQRVPKNWHEADGIKILRNHNALADWARLCVLNNGW